MIDKQNSEESVEARPVAFTRNLSSGLYVLRTKREPEYEKLFAHITRDIDPKDAFEQIYIDGIVFHTWEVMLYVVSRMAF